MTVRTPPASWLLVLIVGLPQFSETVYAPALPDIAKALQVGDAWLEFTFTIYLAGFAIGTLFWGMLSDRFGRKGSLLAGLLIYVAGCIGCYYADTISALLLSRLVQAFGGSTGSVLGQAICRDAFEGKKLNQVYATVSAALAFSPAVGPVVGGLMDQRFGWSSIFLLLVILGLLVCAITNFSLEETLAPSARSKVSIWETANKLFRDKRALAFGLLVAGCNAILFSYYAEGSFYLIENLGLTPSLFGLSFLGIAAAGSAGAWLSKKMHANMSPEAMIRQALIVIMSAFGLFALLTAVFGWIQVDSIWSIALTLLCMMTSSLGIGMALPNVLSLALKDYRNAIGVASALFGCFYYALISLITFGMGLLHNGTLLPMPIYFLVISLMMWWTLVALIDEGKAIDEMVRS